MKKALLIGNYKQAQWHPLSGVDDEIKRILTDFTIDVTEEYQSMKLSEMQAYDLVINYADTLSEHGSPEFAGALLGYVANGGALLAIHNGILADDFPELLQLMGASFIEHPPIEPLKYVKSCDHPIVDMIDSFTINEEPYMFKMDNLANVAVIMEYIYKDKKHPAVWVRAYGNGRVCYFQPGHTSETFVDESVCLLLKRAAMWCTHELS